MIFAFKLEQELGCLHLLTPSLESMARAKPAAFRLPLILCGAA